MAHQLTTNTSTLESVLAQINALPDATSGVELPELSNPATAADALSGKEFIDADGNKVTGTIATKTASDLSASGATVTVPAGYYASQATKSVATATQATPVVSIDSTTGKVSAKASQSAGYVSEGEKTGTLNLTVQATKTITPTKEAQTAVSSGVYTTGAVTVAAIPDQYEDITTPLADLNTLNGNTATTMATAVDNTEAHVSSQEALIAQIATALEEKAAGGGAIKTCTATVTCDNETQISQVIATIVNENGELEAVCPFSSISDTLQTITLDNLACGSALSLSISAALVGYTITGGAERVYADSGTLVNNHLVVKLPTEDNANVMISVYYNN